MNQKERKKNDLILEYAEDVEGNLVANEQLILSVASSIFRRDIINRIGATESGFWWRDVVGAVKHERLYDSGSYCANWWPGVARP